MALHTSAQTLIGLSARERSGDGRKPGRFEVYEYVRGSRIIGSHMPLDTLAHWDWRNPLNIIPAAMLLVVVYALAGTLIALL